MNRKVLTTKTSPQRKAKQSAGFAVLKNLTLKRSTEKEKGI
jgi:hypothetical protein